MLEERPCKQVLNEPSRRLISDDFFDLIIWNQPNGSMDGFQLSYDKLEEERVLTWTPEGGFSHAALDSGEADPQANCTPILNPGGRFPAELVKREFLSRSSEIDPQIRAMVLDKLNEYSSQRPA